MERRHFVIIAQIIYLLPLFGTNRATVAEHFADHLEETNDNFDRIKFLEACREGEASK